jgi:hypothetical protein
MRRWLTLSISAATVVLVGVVPAGPGAVATEEHAEAGLTLAARLAGMTFARARFRQERHLVVLSRPLLSEGEVTLERERRLKWTQAVPYPVTVSITPEAIREEIPGRPARTITPRDNPLMTSVAQAYLALLEGDVGHLETLFSAHLSQSDGRWSLTLVPRRAVLARVISRIRVHGGDVIREIRIDEQSGDWTRIELFDHRPAGAP